MNNFKLWRLVLSNLEKRFSKSSFNIWLKNIEVKKNNEEVTLFLPNIFIKNWLQAKFENDLLASFRKFSPEVKKIKYNIFSKNKQAQEIKKKKNKDPSQITIEFYQNKLSGLNPKYAFKNFIVSDFNRLAHACAQAIIKKPGKVYNPLFVYSGVGLGKTHLLQAIGNEILNTQKKKKVKYIPCPNFTSQVITAIRNQEIDKTIDYYKQFSVLIIDDIEFIIGKEKTQEVFFRIFNDLINRDTQIILSSDRSPVMFENIEERLRSRLGGGMVVDISLPNFEERLVILEKKLEEKEEILPKEIIEFIAENIKKNIRELEGVLIKALVLYEKEQNFEKVIKRLKEEFNKPPKRVLPEDVINTVCEFYHISQKDVLSKIRRQEFVLPRQVIMYLLRKEVNLSLPSIGLKIGNKDHTTVRYGCEKIEKKLRKDSRLQRDLEIIREKLLK